MVRPLELFARVVGSIYSLYRARTDNRLEIARTGCFGGLIFQPRLTDMSRSPQLEHIAGLLSPSSWWANSAR